MIAIMIVFRCFQIFW